jgi:hypothetical protein
MGAVKWIAIWGLVATGAAVLAGILAGYKRRDVSSWAAWSFIFPPLVIVVALLPANAGPRPRRPSFDEDDMTAH